MNKKVIHIYNTSALLPFHFTLTIVPSIPKNKRTFPIWVFSATHVDSVETTLDCSCVLVLGYMQGGTVFAFGYLS